MTKKEEAKQEKVEDKVKEEVKEEVKDEVIELTPEERAKAVQSTINKYILGAVVAGTIPSPAFDVAAISAVQLGLLHSLSKIYNVPFKKELGKSSVASLLGGMGATSIATGTFGSFVKMIPFVGPLVGFITLPVMAGAFTYAVGKIFVQHFEAGGTFLTFDAKKVQGYFKELYNDGKKVATDTFKSSKVKEAK